jgi:hypothetical protein
MNANMNASPEDGGMEGRLWEYIDGSASVDERSVIEKLLADNQQWKEKHRELLELHQLVQTSPLEEPSMRFTKNVMEEIAKYHIAPATRTYIDKKIVWGIGIFFITLILGFLIYGFSQVNWSTDAGDSGRISDVTNVDYSKFFNNTYVNIFMGINVVLGLMLLDRFLASKKKQIHKEA